VHCTSTDIWDNGYPSGGNYWSDYPGTDSLSGPFQNETGSDGIEDSPYTINAENQDRYPLAQPYQGPVRNLNTGDSYLAIQEAVSNAGEGHRILALSGTYHENVVVNKSISLTGEDKHTTIIDGNLTGNTMTIIAANVSVTGFTICNSGVNWPDSGVFIGSGSSVNINGNLFKDNRCGICSNQSLNIDIAANQMVNNGHYGILLMHSRHSRIYGNNITITGHTGILADISRNIAVSGNWISHALHSGVFLQNSYDNSIVDNRITGTCFEDAIQVNYCHNTTIRGNTMTDNYSPLAVYGWELSDFTHDVDSLNTDDGKPIYYLVSQHNLTVPQDAGHVILVNCTHMRVENLNLTSHSFGLHLAFTTESVVTGNAVTDNYFGVYLYASPGNIIWRNHIANNELGVWLRSMHAYQSLNNTLTENTISGNHYGIRLEENSRLNRIYHNNIADNVHQTYYVIPMPANNTWDNGCEGNYWSNYNGTDLDGDGVGDTYLPWEGVDTYPLMNVYWNPGDIDHDLDIDIYDVVKCAIAYGSTPSDPHWNPHCDIAEPYGEIDIFDIVLIATSYGEEYAP
jgi:parallel beta-helix repeat protein